MRQFIKVKDKFIYSSLLGITPGDYTTIKYDCNNIEVIGNIHDNPNKQHRKYFDKYHGLDIDVMFIELSRIDDFPIFEIDLNQVERDYKLHELLSSDFKVNTIVNDSDDTIGDNFKDIKMDADYTLAFFKKKTITNNDPSYVEYLAESLDKCIAYSEYLAENLEKSISYIDHIAKK